MVCGSGQRTRGDDGALTHWNHLKSAGWLGFTYWFTVLVPCQSPQKWIWQRLKEWRYQILIEMANQSAPPGIFGWGNGLQTSPPRKARGLELGRPHVISCVMGKIWKNMTGHQKMVDMICIWYVFMDIPWYSTALRFPDWNIEPEDSSWIGSSVFFPGIFFCAKGLDQLCLFRSLLLCAVLFVLRRNNGCLPSAHVDSFLPNWSTKITTVLFSVQKMFVPLVTQEISVKNYLYNIYIYIYNIITHTCTMQVPNFFLSAEACWISMAKTCHIETMAHMLFYIKTDIKRKRCETNK